MIPPVLDRKYEELTEEVFLDLLKERENKMKKGVVLISGGLDSSTVAYYARKECNELYALTLNYGQAHKRELESAKTIAKMLGVVDHKILNLPLNEIGGSSLFNTDEIPTEEVDGIPSTWVPQRNAIFLAVAYGYAEVNECNAIYMGVSNMDYSGYPDCRPEFIEAMDIALNLASKDYVENGNRITIRTPIIGLTKKETIELGFELGVPYEFTWSCYKGGDRACGLCPSCRLRLEAFKQVGIQDPIDYF